MGNDAPNTLIEQGRLACLRSLNLLDSAPDERFDRITRIAAREFDVPIALMVLVDENRQWFKSKVGLDADETPRSISFCDHTIRGDGVHVIEDAAQDPRFANNPLVVGPPHLRFYAGAPIVIAGQHRIGTFCIADQQPRTFDARSCAKLSSLCQAVRSLIINIHGTQRVLDKVSSHSERQTA